MKSYASIDRIEGKFVVCEVELISVEERSAEEYMPFDTEFIDVSLQEIFNFVGEVKEGDILVVEHDGQNVTFVYNKDNEEKARRLELFRESLEDWTGD